MTATSTADRSTALPRVTVAAEANEPRATLAIVAGVHHGVRLQLDNGDYRIGSTPAADIVLRDAGIVADHAILRIARRSIHLHATGGDVGLGAAVLAKGHGCALRPPVEVTVGEARLHIDVGRRNGPRRSLVSAAVLVTGAVLFAIPPLWVVAPRLGISVARFGDWGRAQASVANADPATPAAPLVTASVDRRPGRGTTLSAAEVEQAARRLAAHLDTGGIHGLSASAAGQHVTVTGSIGKSDAAAWTEAQQWFDQSYGGRIIIAANVTVDGPRATPALSVQAVWFGQHPYIITTEGTRFYKGAALDSGWTIKDIEKDRIILAKASETFALVYR